MNFKNMFLTLSSVLCVMCTSFPLSADAPKQIKDAEELLQQKNYLKAIEVLSRGNIPQEYTDYAYFLQIIALYKSKQPEKALEACNTFIKQNPQSKWIHKVKFFSASIQIEKRDYQSAEALYKEESIRLLSEERKAKIAEQYISFAEYFSYKPKPEELDLPKPDYNKAYKFYEEAIKLEIGPALKEKVRFSMAEMKYLAEDYYTAQKEYEKYLKEYDPDWKPKYNAFPDLMFSHKGVYIYEARLNLAETFLRVSSFTFARIVLEDLIALTQKNLKDARGKKYHRLAMRRLPYAYRLPVPANDYELESGIRTVEDFLKLYPSDSISVTLMWYTTQALIHMNRTDDAIKRLKSFINRENFKVLTGSAEPAEERILRESMGIYLTPEEQFDKYHQEALFQSGNLTFKQADYREAIRIFSDYIARFPNGPHWTKAQSGIIDAEYQIGVNLLEEKKYAEVEKHWNDFLIKHPLDARSRKILFTLAQMYYEEANRLKAENQDGAGEVFQKAITGFRKLVSKYPNTEEASLAQLKIGEVYEQSLKDFESALKAYRDLTWGTWYQEAQARVQKMVNKELVVRTERIFRTTEEAYVTVQVRNIEKLKLSAYKLNLEAYFRKSHSIKGVENLDLALIEPDRKWDMDIKGYSKYLPLEEKIPVEMDGPGVYAITVSSEELEATTLVIRTNIDLIMKSSRKELLVFVQDMVKGIPAHGAKILVTDGNRVILEDTSGKDGVLHKALDELKSTDNLSVFASLSGHIAATGLDLAGLTPASGLTPKGYIYTDQPAYRPGQEVNIKGILRDVAEGSYIIPLKGEENKKEDRYFISVVDAKGRYIHKAPLEIGEYGTFSTSITLSRSAPQGEYSIRVTRESTSHYFTGRFIVQEYKLEKIRLTLEFSQPVYFRGETIEAVFNASYYFGQPFKDGEIRYTTPDNLTLSGKTDAEGNLHITFDTTPFQPDSILSFTGVLAGENVQVKKTIYLAARGYSITMSTDREVSLKGEPVEVTLVTKDAAGGKVSRDLEVSMYRRITKKPDPLIEQVPWLKENQEAQASTWTEVKIETKKVTTSSEGTGRISFSPPEGGQFVFRARGRDRFGNTVTQETHIFVSDEDDEVRLRIFAKRSHYSVGEKDTVLIHTRIKDRTTGLITLEGEGIISYHITSLKQGENPFDLLVDHPHFPNFVFTVSVMDHNKLYKASHSFTVERQLEVKIIPRKKICIPGDEASVEVIITDHLGKPVEAELSLSLVNEALLEQFKDPAAGIVSFFQEGAYREAEMRTDSSCTFAYAPETRSVIKEILIEDERLLDIPEEGAAFEEMEQDYEYEKQKKREKKEDIYDDFFYKEEIVTEEEESSGNFDEKKPEEPDARRELPSGRYWIATIVTDTSGKAKVNIPLPGMTGSFKIRIKGCTKETLVGESEQTIIIRKDFFATLKLPVLLQENDVIRIVGRVHNLTSYSGTVKTRCSVIYNEKTIHLPVKQIDILPNETKEIVFQSYTVPLAKKLDVQLEVDAGTQKDTVIQEVKVRPWGLPVGTRRAGTAQDDVNEFLSLPADREYLSKWMSIILYPALDESLLDCIRPRDASLFFPGDEVFCDFPIGVEADLMATVSLLLYIKGRDDPGNEYRSLMQRAYALVSELISTQKQTGGFSWGKSAESISITAQAYWALVFARKAGIEVEERTIKQAKEFLQKNYTTLPQNDNDLKAEVLHALSLTGDADYTFVNRLYRSRNELSEAALAFTALTLNQLSKPEIARELLALLDAKAQKQEHVSKEIIYWKGENNQPWLRNSMETSALVLLAYQAVEPSSRFIQPGIRYLMAGKSTAGFNPPKAVGYACAALTQFYGQTKPKANDFTLIIQVNGTEVGSLDARAIADKKSGPVFLEVSREILKEGDNHVEIKHSGSGEYSYSISFTGFSKEMKDPQSWTYPRFNIRKYIHEPLRYKGKKIGSSTMEISQLESTGITDVTVDFHGGSRKSYLVLEEFIPAGATVLEDTITGSYSMMEISDGKITFYFKPEQYISSVTYSLSAYSPGTYQVLPSVLHDGFQQEEMRLGSASKLIILAPGETSSEQYVMNKAELYALGKAYFDDGLYEQALDFLEKLYTQDPTYSQPHVARMLLWIRTEEKYYDAKKIVDYFEILKEKYPDLSIPFARILVVGQAYHDIHEYERAYLVYRATIDASFLKDSGIGGYLEKAGEFLASIEYMLGLMAEYPDLSPVISAWFALAQEVYLKAPQAPDLKSRKDIKKKDMGTIYTKAHFLSFAQTMLWNFLSLYPEHELTDDAAFTILNITLDQKKYQATIDSSREFQKRYKESTFFTNYQYMEALGHFSLRKYSDAINIARLVADGTDENRGLATYILGQIYHAQRDPANALNYYKKIKDEFSDAQEAIDYFERKSVGSEEVTIYLPGEKITLPLHYRNIKETHLQIYKVDLMKLYLREKSLSRITGVNLAGITPLHESIIKLGDGKDYEDKSRDIPLNLEDEGAYLAVVRGDDMFTSGLVLITPLTIEVQEDPVSGRIRVNVFDKVRQLYPDSVHVKVIGSKNTEFVSGDTDLRGIFVADGIQGIPTVIARDKSNRYAFYRGKNWVGPEEAVEMQKKDDTDLGQQDFDSQYRSNLYKEQNMIQEENRANLDFLYDQEVEGVMVQEAK
ncbi:MAG: tetratricopeptide repeat protein [Spirochaetales bacterium]|nr:tetratricopeptide repeat protein [Spirochaetales bacterium]